MSKLAKNVGKQFEDNWKTSIPPNVFYYRLKDQAQSFGGCNNLRFSSKNPCDCFLFSSPYMYALELKSVGTSSISFESEEDAKQKKHKVVHYHQIKGLQEFSEYKNIIAGFLFNFRKKDNTEVTYFQHINDFDEMIHSIGKKSFNEKDLARFNPIVVNSRKLRINYRYDVSELLEKLNREREYKHGKKEN